MTASSLWISVVSRHLRSACLILAVLALTATVFNGQTSRRSAAAPPPAAEETNAYKDYRGISLGMPADDVRKKLGTPKVKSDEEDFYVFGESETAQVVYDTTHKVVTISADFLTVGDTVPTAKQVFGGEVEAKADGSVYKMVRFPKAGYWVSFNRTSGAAPLTTVTLQKIQ